MAVEQSGLFLLQWADVLAHELALFAGIFFMIGAADDAAVDAVWLWLRVRSWFKVEKPITLPPRNDKAGYGLAVFIPAWDEANVIGAMLTNTLTAWRGESYCIYVGAYPNDPATVAAISNVAQHTDQIRLVINQHPGPTSKADCLNRLWQAMRADERETGAHMHAVILHDAEDVVHPDALRVFRAHLGRADFIQLPVIALPDPHSRWIAGHYCDEFAEAHGKAMPVRQAIGAGIPAAGVGCAFAIDCLEQIARLRGGASQMPFAESSLTEDYELGLLIKQMGGTGVFVRTRDAQGNWIATRGFFPAQIGAAVRQKSRWIMGIALMGWDRLGWTGLGIQHWAETWMRIRDRRAIIAALVLSAAYLAMALGAALALAGVADIYHARPTSRLLVLIIAVNGLFLCWRAAFRFGFTTAQYGYREGLYGILRLFVGNIIAIMAARRALWSYICWWRGQQPTWDKTRHAFPTSAAALAGVAVAPALMGDSHAP